MRGERTFNSNNTDISFIVCFDLVLFTVVFYFKTRLLIFHFVYFNYQNPALIPFSIHFKIYMFSHHYFSFTFHFKQQASRFYSYTHSYTNATAISSYTNEIQSSYCNLTLLFSLCFIHGQHVIHGARSSGTRDGSISPSEDRLFRLFSMWFDLLNTTSINITYHVKYIPYPRLYYSPYDGPLCPVKGLYHEMHSIVIACRGETGTSYFE